ncbi:hypothetical protein RLEG12_14940 [Rhizobium leguminosarum bv. trifolii CB782]|nr:hypothetical protein [Rhizobium hidalgonense]AHG47869.1 hypothetical protein RLEG12_14940 [Rhizobium leguminosarum bv. trifolii CB782]MDR9813156.1 hypothetical protein [Rhizobium hidalgonense]PON04570.1 hypothetical protein ATY29_26270 [Rhizobium hidalgonense]
MEKTISDISDALGLCLVQGRHGWSDLLCFHHGTVTECRVSEAFSDPVFEMIRLCRAILENRHEIVSLHDEPGGSRLSVTPDIQMQHIMLFEVRTFQSDETEQKPPVLSVRIKRKQLLALLMTELWKLYRFHKELSFQRDRPQFSSADALLQLNAEWDNHPHLGPSLLK